MLKCMTPRLVVVPVQIRLKLAGLTMCPDVHKMTAPLTSEEQLGFCYAVTDHPESIDARVGAKPTLLKK